MEEAQSKKSRGPSPADDHILSLYCAHTSASSSSSPSAQHISSQHIVHSPPPDPVHPQFLSPAANLINCLYLRSVEEDEGIETSTMWGS